jgi:hypothetical protein
MMKWKDLEVGCYDVAEVLTCDLRGGTREKSRNTSFTVAGVSVDFELGTSRIQVAYRPLPLHRFSQSDALVYN